MAATVSPFSISLSFTKTQLITSPKLTPNTVKSKPFLSNQTINTINHKVSFLSAPFTTIKASCNDSVETSKEKDLVLPGFKERPGKFIFLVVLWASVSIVWFATSGDANAAVDSIRASTFGLKIANSLRKWGWPDETVVFALATLPVIELRGAIPVGYWMQLSPIVLTIWSVLGLVCFYCFLIIICFRLKHVLCLILVD